METYYMASNSSVLIECSDWLVFGRDLTVRTITIETVLFGYFFSTPAPAKFELQKRKKIKKGKVWSWYETNERDKHGSV